MRRNFLGSGESNAVYRFEFSLGTVEASVVGRALGVDIRQFPLRIGPTSADPDRYARLAKQVYLDLSARRLSVAGELNRFVRSSFELLGDHRVSVAVSGSDVEIGEIAVLSVTDGAQALLVAQPDGQDQLWFRLLPDDELVDALAGALPPLGPAPGGPLTVSQQAPRRLSAVAARRQADVEFDEEETEAFGSLQINAVVSSGARRRRRDAGYTDQERLEDILAGPRLGGGYFVATGRTRHNEQRRTSPLTWLDTEQGRYLVEASTDQAGTTTAQYSPAGNDEVADGIAQLVSAVY